MRKKIITVTLILVVGVILLLVLGRNEVPRVKGFVAGVIFTACVSKLN